jgi:hypothetical protein
MPQITRLDIRGTEVPVEVSSHGHFSGRIGDEWFEADTLGALREKLMMASRKAAAGVKVPFTQMHNNEIRHGVATGRHASQRRILVTWDDGKKGQLETWGNPAIMWRLQAHEESELRDLMAAERDAREALAAFIAARRTDMGVKVDRAVKDAIIAISE